MGEELMMWSLQLELCNAIQAPLVASIRVPPLRIFQRQAELTFENIVITAAAMGLQELSTISWANSLGCSFAAFTPISTTLATVGSGAQVLEHLLGTTERSTTVMGPSASTLKSVGQLT